MYYDLKFPYRISEEAGLAHDEDGNNVEAFVRIKIENCKNSVTEEQYNEMHEENRETVALMLKKDVEWIFMITGEEYAANVDEEE